MIRDIRKDLDAFKASPSEAELEKVEKSFVKIDAAIKDLEAKEDLAQADLFRRQAMTLRYEYRAMHAAYLTWKQEQAVKPTSTGSGK
jgi:predicted  nucleic acid-binding Zn-ribbon protein